MRASRSLTAFSLKPGDTPRSRAYNRSTCRSTWLSPPGSAAQACRVLSAVHHKAVRQSQRSCADDLARHSAHDQQADRRSDAAFRCTNASVALGPHLAPCEQARQGRRLGAVPHVAAGARHVVAHRVAVQVGVPTIWHGLPCSSCAQLSHRDSCSAAHRLWSKPTMLPRPARRGS